VTKEVSSSGRGARWIPVAQAQRGLQLEAALLDRPTEHVLALAQAIGDPVWWMLRRFAVALITSPSRRQVDSVARRRVLASSSASSAPSSRATNARACSMAAHSGPRTATFAQRATRPGRVAATFATRRTPSASLSLARKPETPALARRSPSQTPSRRESSSASASAPR